MSEKAMRDRASTEQKLISVAMKLIREKGVVSGLNLREVAEGCFFTR